VRRVELRIDVAIGDEEIEPAIGIVVKEVRAPADLEKIGSAQPGRPAHLGECTCAEISVERIRLIGIVGHEKIELPVIIVIRPGSRPGSAKVIDNASGGDFGKCPIPYRRSSVRTCTNIIPFDPILGGQELDAHLIGDQGQVVIDEQDGHT
jgi:hypothetical protein